MVYKKLFREYILDYFKPYKVYYITPFDSCQKFWLVKKIFKYKFTFTKLKFNLSFSYSYKPLGLWTYNSKFINLKQLDNENYIFGLIILESFKTIDEFKEWYILHFFINEI